MKKQDKGQLFEAMSLVGAIGINMVACVAVGLFVGRWLDNWLNIFPWATVAGIVIGLISGFWATYKRVTKVESGK